MKNRKLTKSIVAVVAIAALSTNTFSQVSEETLGGGSEFSLQGKSAFDR